MNKPNPRLLALRSLIAPCLFLIAPISATEAQVYEKVFSFTSNSAGVFPTASVIQGGDGNLYGTTEGDGLRSQGAVYRVTTAGELTTLLEFTGIGGNNRGSSP